MTHTPIQFESQRQFEELPGYSESLECTTEDLDRIVGKYSWDQHRALRCGLNHCNRLHWHGYVIASKGGRMTHCGQDCGAREFGVQFEDVEASYRLAEEDALRAANIAEALRQRNELLAKAEAVEAAVIVKVAAIRAIVSTVEADPALTKALGEALRTDGRIQQVIMLDRDTRAAMGQKPKDEFIVTDIGRIDAANAVRQQRDIGGHVRADAIWPLRQLTAESLEGLSRKALTSKSSEITAARQAIQDGERFVDLAVRFLAPSNMHELAKLAQVIPARARSQRVAKIVLRITQSMETTTEAGPGR